MRKSECLGRAKDYSLIEENEVFEDFGSVDKSVC